MRKLEIYLDTSVVSHLLQEDVPEKMADTRHMEKPVLSPNFTIEDIHKLREYNYHLTKDMTPQERQNFYNERERVFQREIEAGRLQKA